MAIGIDIRVLAKGKRTGVEDYTINLLSRILADKTNKYQLFYNGFKKLKADHFWLKGKNIKIKKLRIPNRLFDLFLKIFKLPKIDKILGGVDVFFSPHFLITPLSKNAKRILVFYDLSFLRFPNFFPFSKRLWHKFMSPQRQAQGADLIIAISESTKQDLVDFYKISPSKIKVIYPGIDEKFKPVERNDPKLMEVAEKYNLPARFVLYFGTIEPRKNILGLIKAFEEIKRSKGGRILNVNWLGLEGFVKKDHEKFVDFSDLKLVIAGTRGWLYEEVFTTVKNSEFKEDIIFTGFIDEEDKPYLYNLASVFVYPSFFEGFGLPPLEAMACGVPTIVSHKSSLPEVVGKSAIMIDPQNLDELVFAIKEVLRDRDFSDYLKNLGLSQARLFNWDKVASEFLKIFHENWN